MIYKILIIGLLILIALALLAISTTLQAIQNQLKNNYSAQVGNATVIEIAIKDLIETIKKKK